MSDRTPSRAAPASHRPPLDGGFVPAHRWRQAYRRMLSAERRPTPVTIAVGRPGGGTSHFRTCILPHEEPYTAANVRFLERTVKFLLWSRGGSRVFIAGAPEATAVISAGYSPGGARAFDAEFLGRKIYLDEFSVRSCRESELPTATDCAGAGGGGASGCRIGFDLGGSDRKVAALIDGEVDFPRRSRGILISRRIPPTMKKAFATACAAPPRICPVSTPSAGVRPVSTWTTNRGPARSFAGQLMNESHESSRTLFENSCEELDFLAAEARTIPGCLGARLTGGGFGGAVLALVRRGTEDDFVKSIGKSVSRAWGKVPQTLVTGAGGA